MFSRDVLPACARAYRLTAMICVAVSFGTLSFACRKQPKATPDAHVPNACETARLRFHRFDLAPVGLALDVIDGTDVTNEGTPAAPPGEHEGWIAQRTPEVSLALRYGPDATLTVWRSAVEQDTAPIVFEPEVTTSVCGRSARRQQYTDPGYVEEVTAHPAPSAAAPTPEAAPAPPGSPRPPTVHVAISFEQRGIPTLLSWSGPTANVAHLRCVEEHLLRGLSCR